MSEAEALAHGPEGIEAPSALEQEQATATFGIWVFLAAECAFFASLIGTYLSLKGGLNGGLGPKQLFDLPLTLAGTLILLFSSLTMVLGYAAAQRNDTMKTQLWLAVTAWLGAMFLGFQVYEFTSFIHKGLSLSYSAFASGFFTLTGFHGLHVAFGIFWILSLLRRSQKITPRFTHKVFVASLYWHFVDVVWVVIFTVVYLMGKVG